MPDAVSQKVRSQVEEWKRRLLDLTRRNRLLNFRATTRSTVTIVDEMPAEVFRTLWLDEKAMRFRAAGAPSEGAEAAGDGDDGTPFEAYDPAALPERHRDDQLQTRLDRTQLERSLRYIAQQAKSAMEEQGVGTMFLALGMLHFRPEERAEEMQRAPVILLEVELEQAARNALPKLKAAGEAPIVNPTLAEYLRRNHGVSLPDTDEIEDPVAFFAQVRAAIARFPDWELRNEIHLGLFSFQKLVMFKDLERHAGVFAANALAQRLCDPGHGVPPGLPADVAALELDAAYPPEAARVVMDADASQLRAIAAVDRGHHLVIEGPPGTGKSQTIANLIAHLVGAGRTVLFVSEKMAALEVVFGRLKRAGLGDFCFELHSQKARRSVAIADLARSWQATLGAPALSPAAATRLAETRAVLTAYAHELHLPFGALGWSPFRAIGELELVRDAAAWRWPGGAKAVGEAALETGEEALRAWTEAAAAVGDPREHPWRFSRRDYWSAAALEDLQPLATALRAACARWSEAAGAAAAALGTGAVRTVGDAAAVEGFAERLARSPGAEPALLAHAAWREAGEGLPERLVAAVREAARLRAAVLERMVPAALDAAHADDLAVVRQRGASWHRMLHADYRAVRARWIAYRVPGWKPSMAEQAARLDAAVAYQAQRAFLAEHDALAREVFGARWAGEAGDADALAAFAAWLRDYATFCAAHAIPDAARDRARAAAPETAAAGALAVATADVATAGAAFTAAAQWETAPAGEDADRFAPAGGAARSLAPGALGAHVAALLAGFDRSAAWCAYLRARARAEQAAGGAIVAAAEADPALFASLARVWRCAFLRAWLEDAVAERPRLQEFDSAIHERRVSDFRDLDQRIHDINRDGIVAARRAATQAALAAPELSDQVGLLRREIGRKARFQPLRRTLAQAFGAIRAIKPCFLMSPLTVAQCLDPAEHRFDVVIFDEASQLTPEDAIGAIVRGDRLVVTGDQKQLPPTNFFAVQTVQTDDVSAEDGMPLYEDSESILELCQRSSVPSTTLRWHYRSRHESLITFSNQSFYDGSLLTFPSADTDCSVRGLRFEFVEEGRYTGSGENKLEAERVVAAVCEHAERFAREGGECPTLGVGTFNVRQQGLILDLLAERRRGHAALDEYLARDKEHGFFVKNLENIQGDDRDHIFLSVTYGRNDQGRVRLNFGPINGENGWRRLNVLVTRARSVMRVFASMRADDIDTASETLGVKLLRKYLRYAETGRLEDRIDDAAAQVESPFEGQVRRALEARGYDVVSQVGAAGYRIDLAIKDRYFPGRYVCGIECDGASYHSSETARDRDRLRQQILEDLGWRIHRIWSTDWFKDRKRQLERVSALIERSRGLAKEDAAKRSRSASGGVARAAGRAAAPATPAAAAPPPAADLPTLADYRFAAVTAPQATQDFYAVGITVLARQVAEVAAGEGPVHEWDVIQRVAETWGLARAGSTIQARVREAIGEAVRAGSVAAADGFVSRPGAKVTPRSREGVDMPVERIAPAEVAAAVRLALAALGAAERDDLVVKVARMFGFKSTGPNIKAWFGDVIATMAAAGELGEGPFGLSLLRK